MSSIYLYLHARTPSSQKSHPTESVNKDQLKVGEILHMGIYSRDFGIGHSLGKGLEPTRWSPFKRVEPPYLWIGIRSNDVHIYLCSLLNGNLFDERAIHASQWFSQRKGGVFPGTVRQSPSAQGFRYVENLNGHS